MYVRICGTVDVVLCTYVHTYIRMYACMFVCVRVCIYIRTYLRIYVHIHTYIQKLYVLNRAFLYIVCVHRQQSIW